MFHTVIYNQGAQALKTIPFKDGRPVVVASATYKIVDLRKADEDSDRDVVASTAAIVDSYSGTTQATAGPGASDMRRIDVDDVTGLAVGERLLLTGGGAQELVEVRALNASSNYVYTTADISETYASGATLSGIEVSGTFPSAEAADEEALEEGGGPYAIEWTFTGAPSPVRELVWLRRHARTPTITVDDLDTLDPQLVRTTSNLFEVDKIIEQAERDFNAELLARDIQPERFYGTELARNCVAYRAAYLGRLHMGRQSDDPMLEHYHGRWMGLINTLTHGKPGKGVAETSVDDSSGAGETDSVFGLVRLS